MRKNLIFIFFNNLAERIAGKRTDKLNATDAIWEFFERRRRP